MITQCCIKVAKVKVPGVLSTLDDSTLAFHFTGNSLQVQEDSLTAVPTVDSGDVCV